MLKDSQTLKRRCKPMVCPAAVTPIRVDYK